MELLLIVGLGVQKGAAEFGSEFFELNQLPLAPHDLGLQCMHSHVFTRRSSEVRIPFIPTTIEFHSFVVV
jgi:hypothetical protein